MAWRHAIALGAIIGGFGPAADVAAQICPATATSSAAGIKPIFVPGDPSCADAFAICGFQEGAQIVRSPPSSLLTGAFRIQVAPACGGAALDVKDVSPASQQNGTPGYKVAIVRRNGANIYCGTGVLHDVVRPPGTGTPTQLTICWAKGPCGINETQVGNACAQYNQPVRKADFLQAYKVGPIEQDVDVCGCAPSVAQFCDARQPIFVPQTSPPEPRFVACNPDNSPLKATEAESLATEGSETCIWMTIGGRRVLVDKDGTDPKC